MVRRLVNAAAILNNLTIKATMTGWSLDRLISGEFEHASDYKLLNTLRSAIIPCNEMVNGNGTPSCMHTKACSGQETEEWPKVLMYAKRLPCSHSHPNKYFPSMQSRQ